VLIRIYHRLLDRIAADPAAVFRERVSVPTSQKLSILGGGCCTGVSADASVGMTTVNQSRCAGRRSGTRWGRGSGGAVGRRALGVTLLERKPYVGGRAYSYAHPALEEVIDSQHVLLGCCTNLIDLCQLSGADKHIRWYDHYSIF
jgi:hypothetical protein